MNLFKISFFYFISVIHFSTSLCAEQNYFGYNSNTHNTNNNYLPSLNNLPSSGTYSRTFPSAFAPLPTINSNTAFATLPSTQNTLPYSNYQNTLLDQSQQTLQDNSKRISKMADTIDTLTNNVMSLLNNFNTFSTTINTLVQDTAKNTAAIKELQEKILSQNNNLFFNQAAATAYQSSTVSLNTISNTQPILPPINTLNSNTYQLPNIPVPRSAYSFNTNENDDTQSTASETYTNDQNISTIHAKYKKKHPTIGKTIARVDQQKSKKTKSANTNTTRTSSGRRTNHVNYNVDDTFDKLLGEPSHSKKNHDGL